MAQTIYDIPSLAAWRAAELKALATVHFRNSRCSRSAAVTGASRRYFCSGWTGAWTSTLAKWNCAPRAVGIYRRLGCMDARRLTFADGVFATVFANCVVEHIPDLARVLAECRRVLRPGGAFIATVPLIEMNRHLLLPSAWYARSRAKQLQHLNLLTEDAWVAALSQAGFATVRTTPYLSARMCELWDRVDGPLCMGAGPLTLGRAYRIGLRLLPTPWRTKLNRQWQHYFISALQQDPAAMSVCDADPGRGALRYRRLGATARNIGLVLGGQAGLSASRFAALLLVSHLVAPARFDECAIYASSSLVVGNLSELGINISCLKFAAGATGLDWLRTVSRFLLLRLALTAGVIAAVFLFAPLVSAKLLRHPEYATALRLACGSAAVASVSSFALVLLQSRLQFARMARLNAAAAILQILPVMLVFRGRFSGVAGLFAGDMLSRLWIVIANLSLLAAVLAVARQPGPRPGWKPIAVFANWITMSTVIGSLYSYIPSIALSRWAAASALGTYTLGHVVERRIWAPDQHHQHSAFAGSHRGKHPGAPPQLFANLFAGSRAAGRGAARPDLALRIAGRVPVPRRPCRALCESSNCWRRRTSRYWWPIRCNSCFTAQDARSGVRHPTP